MASRQAIITAIQLLKANGVQSSPSGEALAVVVATWERLLVEVTDEDLEAATLAHLGTADECRWWPQPGMILDRARRISYERADRERANVEAERRKQITLSLVHDASRPLPPQGRLVRAS